MISGTLPAVGDPTGQVPPLDATIDTGKAIEYVPSPTEELMSRVQRGDMDAYQQLVRLYQRKVFRVISGYHRDPEDAMEVVQDTFLKVYTARQTWERRTSFSAWLYRIAINASIDRYRRSSRAKTTPLEELSDGQLQEPGEAECTPLDVIQDQERRRLLERAVRRLPDRQREVVALRYFADLRLEEIAGVLNCPLGTVKSNLHKAVLALKAMLSGQKEVLSYE